jgi:carboxypeptidase D
MHTSREFPQGLTNGAQWYVLSGGMQDYVYEQTNAMELTIEVSNVKYPFASHLERYWQDNLPAMLRFMEMTHSGVSGVVTDKNGSPLRNAVIEVRHGLARLQHTIRTGPHGEYTRILLPGTYTIRVSSPGHSAQEKSVTCGEMGKGAALLNFALQ